MDKTIVRFFLVCFSCVTLGFSQVSYADDASTITSGELITGGLVAGVAVGIIALLAHNNNSNGHGGTTPGNEPILRWQATDGPYAGISIKALLTSSSAGNAAEVYAATQYGVFVSSDHGQHWKASLPGFSISYLAKDSINNIYATGMFAAAGLPVFFVSKDHGKTWAPLDITHLNSLIQPSALFIDNNDVIYLGSNSGGAYASIDHGATWKQIINSADEIIDFTQDPNNLIYAAGIRNYGNGSLWQINADGTAQDLTGLQIIPMPNGTHVLATYANIPTRKDVKTPNYAVFISTNSGVWIYKGQGSWTTVFNNIVGTDIQNKPNGDIYLGLSAFFTKKNIPNTGIYVCPNDGQRTCQSDADWLPSKVNTNTVNEFAFNGKYVFAGSLDGVFEYDGSTWNNPDPSIASANIFCIAADTSTVYAGSYTAWFAGSPSSGVYYSNYINPNALVWKNSSTTMPAAIATFKPIFVNNNVYLFSSYPVGVFLSQDAGATWSHNLFPPSSLWIDAAAVTRNNKINTIYVISFMNLSFSQDDGHTWKTLPENNKNQFLSFGALATNHDGNTIYAGSLGQPAYIYWSKDGGNNWEHTDSSALVSQANGIRSLAVDEYRGVETVYAGARMSYGKNSLSGIFTSSDMNHWTNSYTANELIDSIVVDPSRHFIYAISEASEEANASQTQYNLLTYDAKVSGQGWEKIPLKTYPFHFTVNPINGDLYYTLQGGVGKNTPTYSTGLYVSIDRGHNWNAIQQFNNLAVTDISIDSFGNVYVGTDGTGVYVSFDHYQTWEKENSGLNNLFVTKLGIDDFGYIYAPTTGDVLYREVRLLDKVHELTKNTFSAKINMAVTLDEPTKKQLLTQQCEFMQKYPTRDKSEACAKLLQQL